MKTKEILSHSLGEYSQQLYEAFKEGYKLSDNPSYYPWVDHLYHAIMELPNEIAPQIEKPQADKPQADKPQRGRPVKS